MCVCVCVYSVLLLLLLRGTLDELKQDGRAPSERGRVCVCKWAKWVRVCDLGYANEVDIGY